MRRVASLVVLTLVSLSMPACKDSQPTQKVSTGAFAVENAFPRLTFKEPVGLVASPDLSGRLFVLERSGRILVFTSAAESTSTFLDIRDRVVASGPEEGLLGLAFHSDFAVNGIFYLNYTAPGPLRTVISKFQLNGADRSKADPASENILLVINQPADNHNGGQLLFGPDHYLYIGVGDGGFAGDPDNRAQDTTQLLGKVLRIDVDHPAGGLPYGIPSDNPFVNTNGRGEIWALGFRNPWRLSFDPVTGRLWAGDVGQAQMEEVDVVQRGKNYGWRRMEGTLCFAPKENCDTSGLVPPVWEYEHNVGICIIGGVVYRGTRFPGLIGQYLCADYGSGRIWAVADNGTQSSTAIELANTGLPFTSFGTDVQGEVYLCCYDGKIYQLTPNP